MRCADRIQGEKTRRQSAVGVGLVATLHMPTASAARSACTQALMVEALPQKKQNWWLSTTSHGDFQPKKILIQTADARATYWPARRRVGPAVYYHIVISDT